MNVEGPRDREKGGGGGGVVEGRVEISKPRGKPEGDSENNAGSCYSLCTGDSLAC